MGEYTATHQPGEDTTWTATAAVTGGMVVEISATGMSAAPTTAASNKVVGIAEYDALVGGQFTVADGGYQTPLAGSAITAGALLKTAALGRVVPWIDGTDSPALVVAKAVNTQATTGSPVLVKWVL